jgi:hypothetical protein
MVSSGLLRRVRRLLVAACVVPSSPIFVTLMKEAPVSSETSVLRRATRRNNLTRVILLTHSYLGGCRQDSQTASRASSPVSQSFTSSTDLNRTKQLHNVAYVAGETSLYKQGNKRCPSLPSRDHVTLRHSPSPRMPVSPTLAVQMRFPD